MEVRHVMHSQARANITRSSKMRISSPSTRSLPWPVLERRPQKEGRERGRDCGCSVAVVEMHNSQR
jgi:hypothetical protein